MCAHTCICMHLHLRERREQGPTWSPREDAWDSVRIEGVVTARCWFLLFCLAGLPPPWCFQPFRPDTSFITWGWAPEESNVLTAFALSSHLALRGVSLGAPPAGLWPGCGFAGGLDQGGPVLPLSPSFPHLGPRPWRPTADSLPVGPWHLPDPLMTVARCPPPGVVVTVQQDGPCEEARRKCLVDVSPVIRGPSAASTRERPPRC